ncbi:MAG: class I SAM-dependent methyltransferase [Candidatus Marinimicrobia bacterium]|nr:class I SAM-dependent methyltransferase [Candidatus Neomarinimicrobiota bacterium]
MKKFIKFFIPIVDVFLSPFVYPSAFLLKIIRRAGVHRLPFCKKVLLNVGVFPIRNHYHEPLFDEREIRYPLSENRRLPGIDWNVTEQLTILASFNFNEELNNIPTSKVDDLTFYMSNRAFSSGDAEYWYSLIRLKKPKRIIEIGSGNSTLMAMKAIARNKKETTSYKCKHICIEPYRRPWLEKSGVSVIRQKVEDVNSNLFSELGENDILFIDSSHIIRPQGDVLFEYLQLLPTLQRGVIVHIHDIFSPKDYPDEWVKEKVRFWNEQYLLEAFLTSNRDWKIIGALNYLHHNHYEKLKDKCPFLTSDREPGSFYIQKIA